MSKEFIRANKIFTQGAKEVFFGDGAQWYKQAMEGFTPQDFEYMRSIEEELNTYLFAIDIDALAGFSADVLACAKDMRAYFGRGILKASGQKGMHVIPFRVRFPPSYPGWACLKNLSNLAYTAYMERDIWATYGFPFLKRTKATPDWLIERGYIDTTMFTKSRKIRGFCRRFKDKQRVEAWSVPIGPDDDAETAFDKIARRIEPEWRIAIPTVTFRPEMVKHQAPEARKKSAVARSTDMPELDDKDTLDKIMEKIMFVMPGPVKAVWYSADPAHEEKFGTVCWLNQALKERCPDPAKRAALIAELIIRYMSLDSYRDSGRFSEHTTRYQVYTIVTGKEGGYDPPRWVWDNEKV